MATTTLSVPTAGTNAPPSTPASPHPATRPGLVARPSSIATMGKTIVLVTGGNTGIGFEIVKALSKQPELQILMGCRDTKKGEAAAASMGAPMNVNPIQLDITDDASIEHCVKTVQQLFGRLDVLINNAGTAGLDLTRAGMKPTPRQEWDHVMNVNVTSTCVLTDAMIPIMQKSRLAKIIFVSSRLGSISRLKEAGVEFNLSYQASKTAVNMATAWYAKKYKDFKVNAVCPGYRATGLNDGALNDETDPALGAVRAVQLVNEGLDGATGTYSATEFSLPW